MTESLNPCPFCGGAVEQVHMNVVCVKCSAITVFSICGVDSHARRLWNTRAHPTPDSSTTESYGVRWESFGMSGGTPVGNLMEAVAFYNEKIAEGKKASVYRIHAPSEDSEDLRALKEIVQQYEYDFGETMNVIAAKGYLQRREMRSVCQHRHSDNVEANQQPDDLRKAFENWWGTQETGRLHINSAIGNAAYQAWQAAWGHKRESSWQPIETAPKDGAWIMTYCPDALISSFPTICFWDDEWVSTRSMEVMHPTHWMPIPQPPEQGRRGSGD